MADLELNSIGNGDGNNYLVRDNTKIPLSGSNQISGSLIPSTDGTVNLGGSSYQWNNAYIKSLTINGVACGDILTHNASEFIPRSGGQVIKGNILATANTKSFSVGHGWGSGGTIYFYNSNSSERTGGVTIQPYLVTTPSDIFSTMNILPGGTWTWNGQAVQTTSDQRYKQQIAQIDDDLLTAWEDVNLVQFKYNDAVETKSDNARLHTGYVVQQIDEACKSHGVDVSKYGLYCHEEYEEETREVEQADGTKKTEVVRPASEHYSLRYTEALIVECAYLRKCIKELRNEIEELKSSKEGLVLNYVSRT